MLSVVALGSTAGSSSAAPSTTQGVRLITASEEAYAWRDGRWVYFEPSVWLAAYGQGIEFWATRDRYADPVTMTKTVIRGARRTTTDVPDDLVDGFNGLKNGLTTTIATPAGRVLQSDTQSLCPGGWNRQRVDPTGPADPVYPYSCWANPFTQGTVLGIEQGWAVGVVDYLSLRTPRNQLVLTVEISPRVARVLGIPADERTISQRITVVEDPCQFGCRGDEGAVETRRDRVQERTTDLPGAVAPASSATRRALPRTATTRAPARGTMPDLVSLPAFWINTEPDETGVDRLNFAANEWNAGPAPMVVEGYRRGTQPIMDAYQVFYRNGEPVETRRTGTMEFHDEDEHMHWHFLDFARYDLVRMNGALVTSSGKQSWCLAPTEPIDLRRPGSTYRPEDTGLSSSCGGQEALWLRETLPVGWGDTYSQYQTQAFDLTGVPNGRYQIKVTVNPDGNLFERSMANNVSLRTVILGGRPGARTVEVPPYQGLDTETFDFDGGE